MRGEVVKCLLLGAAMARTAKHNPRAASKKQQQPISTYFASTTPAAPPAALDRAGASSKKEEKFGLPGASTPTGSYKRKQGEDWYPKRADGTDVVVPYRYVMTPSGEDSPARNTRAKKNLRSLNIALKKAGHGVGSGRDASNKNPNMREVPVSSSPRARVFESYSGLSQTLDVVTCVPTDRVVQMIAADGTPYVGVEWAGDRTMTLRDRSDIEKCDKSRAETAMRASSKKDAKETEAETEPPGTPAKEERTAPPEQQ